MWNRSAPDAKPSAGLQFLELPHEKAEAGDNLREVVQDESFEQLVESVRRHGQLVPGSGYWDERRERVYLVSGHRRFLATQVAGLPFFKVLVHDRVPDPNEKRLLQLTENLHRKDLTAIEEARAFKALLDESGMSARELAERLSVSHTTITRAIALLRHRPEILAAIQGGTLSPAHGRALARLNDPDVIDRVFEEVRTRALTAEQTDKLVTARLRPRRTGTRAVKPTRRRFALGSFEAVVESRRVVIRPKGHGKRPAQPLDLIGAIESLLARLREEDGGASAPVAPTSSDEPTALAPGGQS